ncbi:ferredoxin [Candidatus Peregrinibacteria bacterium]|nr:ferredoxin [Candidatus Peregrinibacteria bacterium]
MQGAYVDPDKCIGCTLCVSISPKIFEMQPDGKSKAVNPTAEATDVIEKAIAACPVQAISMKDYN